MKYIFDIFQRFQSVYGIIGANAQAFANAALFRAGMAANESRYTGAGDNEKDYQFEVYTGENDIFNTNARWADLLLKYNDDVLKFSFESMLRDTPGIIAPPPLVSFRRSKNLGITVIDDSEGEIVENFGINSWDIDIRGMLIDMDNHFYPGEKIRELVKFFNIPDVIEVTSTLFQDMGVSSIYFKEQSIEPVEAFPDTVRFTLLAKSIKPAEISYLNGL